MSIDDHYRALRGAAGVYQRGASFLRVSGAGRVDLLDFALARSSEFSQPGTVLETLALDEDGKVIDQVLAVLDEDDAILVGHAEQGVLAQLTDLAEERSVEDTEIETLDDWSAVAIEGPLAWKVVADLVEDEIATFALSEWTTVSVPDVLSDGRLVRTGTTGEYGYLVVGAADAVELLEYLSKKAEEVVDGGQVGFPAVLRASIEVSHPIYPDLFVNDISVAEAGVQWAAGVGRDEDFRGKDGALTADRERGLVAFTVPDGAVPAAGTDIEAGDQRVGVVHIVAADVDDADGFGLALLDVPFCVPGLELTAGDTTVTTVSRPHAELRSWSQPIG